MSLHDAAYDLRHAARGFRRTPGFAIAAALTLALGIGVTTAVVSVVDHVVLRALPFRDANRLVMLLERDDRGGFRPPSAPTTADWSADPGARQAFDGITFVRGDGATIRKGDVTEAISVAYVTPYFFPLMGARPALGRSLIDDDHRPDAPPVAVLSFETWRRTFGSDPSIVGQKIDINGVPTTVVGVMPLGATYPGFALAWQPISHYTHQEILSRRGFHADSRTIGRLKPGVDSARAVALMKTITTRLGDSYPAEQAHWGAAMMTVQREVLGGIEPTLFTLGAAAVAVLLLACVNVANLILVRVASRGREFAVRGALGASRMRIVQQLLAEALLLAGTGGVLGILIAALSVRVTKKFIGARLPRVDELAVDERVLLVAIGASLLTALVCGLWPAVRASRPSHADALRASTSGSVGGRREARLRRMLVTIQFSLALVLLVGAGLLMQSFRRAMAVDVGLDPHNLVAVRLNPPAASYPTAEASAALYARLMDAVRAVPGVTDAAFIQHRPLAPSGILTPVEIEGAGGSDTASRQIYYRTVSDTYLRTMRMSMAAGRWFDANDIRSPGGGFVVNRAMANRFWPGENAIGKRLTIRRSSQARKDFGQPLPGVVIGVINDVHQVSQDQPASPEVFVPYTLETWPWGSLVIRTRDGMRAIPALTAAIAGVDPQLIEKGATGEGRFSSMEQALGFALKPRELAMSLIGVFAACALVLAAIGMYGVVAYGITQRTRELGLRKALGATDAVIISMLLRESLALTLAGVVIGCGGAWAAARLIRDQLFGTGVVDPATYSATIAVLAIVALLATWIPSRRATRLDPTIAMRGE